jgi:cyclase
MNLRTSRRNSLLIVLLASASAAPVTAQTPRRITELAPGVYAIEHRDDQDGFAGGNTTVIIGDRQVMVVDASFLPSDAREDIAQIRRWTEKPVTFLLNTHFHNDHNLGNRIYMDSFPALTIIAHRETKKEMDLFGPGSAGREARGTASYQRMLDSGKNGDGSRLSDADKTELRKILARRHEVGAEIDRLQFQSATLTFDRDFTIDLGNREVRIRFLGRGNTDGDAIAYLPTERILAAGDLVVHPFPYFYDGYPSEWIGTLENLAAMNANAIVPGHGPILHDNRYVLTIRDLLQSAVTQMNEALRKVGPAMFRNVESVRSQVDLTSFRQRLAGSDPALGAAFDQMVNDLVTLVFREASLR